MANYVDNTIEISTNHPALIELLRSLEGYDTEVLQTLCPIGAWDYDKAHDAWGCTGLIDCTLSVCSIEEGEAKFHIYAQTKWTFPSTFLENLMERFAVGGEFTTHIRCEWIEESGFVGLWEYGDEFETKLDFEEDILVRSEKYMHLCEQYSLLDFDDFFEGWRESYLEDMEE